MKIMAVRRYFDTVTDKLFKFRQASRARFRIATGEMYTSIGAYGTGPLYVGKRKPNALYNAPSFMYKGCLLRDVFILVNDDDEVEAVYRRFFLNARMWKSKFPDLPLPRALSNNVKSETAMEEFVHVVRVRTDHDPEAIDARHMPVVGSYLNVKDQEYVGEEHGFRSIPYLTPRTMTVSGDPYGFAPSVRVLSNMGGASAMKKTQIKQGQKAADPVLLTYDDGVMNGEVDLRPGAVNPGGLDAQGRELVKTMQTGNFQVSEKLIEDDRMDIEDSFFVTLFQILNETPEMTATEVIERVAEKTALIAPTMGRLQSEFLGPCTEREIDLLIELGEMPPMPPELQEAQGEYEIQYTSPMAKGIHAEESAGFVRTVEMAISVANATGDPSPLDHFDFDTALPEIADNQGTPARWINDAKVVEQMREVRAQKQQEAMAMQNAAGLSQAAKVAGELQQQQPKQVQRQGRGA
jgi:hypothetical protein